MYAMIVVPGPASMELGEAVAAQLGLAAHPVEHRLFPDGESYLRLPPPSGARRRCSSRPRPPTQTGN